MQIGIKLRGAATLCAGAVLLAACGSSVTVRDADGNRVDPSRKAVLQDSSIPVMVDALKKAYCSAPNEWANGGQDGRLGWVILTCNSPDSTVQWWVYPNASEFDVARRRGFPCTKGVTIVFGKTWYATVQRSQAKAVKMIDDGAEQGSCE